MENKIIKRTIRDLYFLLRRPVSYPTVIAMVSFQIERFTQDRKKEFKHANVLKRMFCYPDTYHWKVESHPDNRRKVKISIVHDVHDKLVFNLFRGDAHDNYDPYFDDAETTYSILIKPIEVEDMDWVKLQNHFLLEFHPYMVNEVKVRRLGSGLNDDYSLKAKNITRNRFVRAYESVLKELCLIRLRRDIIRDMF